MADTYIRSPEIPDFADLGDEVEKQGLPRWVDKSREDLSSASTSTLTSTTPITTKDTSKRPTAFLDGLRGLAAFLVYMSHHIPWFYGFDHAENSLERAYGDGGKELAQLPLFRAFFTGGSAAVAIFFVLSGYVLSIGPLAKIRGGRYNQCYVDLVSATVRRPFRLFLPAVGVSLALVCVMQLPFGLSPHMTWPDAKENLFLELLRWFEEFGRIVDPFRDHGIAERWFPYNPPLWTIAIEFRGSIVVFAAIAAYSKTGPLMRFFLFSLTAVICLLMYEWSMWCFMAGVALAINDQEGFDAKVFKRMYLRVRMYIHIAIFLFGWWLLCQPAGKREPARAMKATGWYYMTLLTPANYYRKEYWRFWHAIGAVAVIYGVLKLRFLQRLFNTRPMQYLGRVSFALYLVHIPVLWTLGDRVYRMFGTTRFDFKTPFDNILYVPDVGPRGLSTRWILSQAFVLPATLLLANLVTKYMDGPGIRFSRWIASKVVPASWRRRDAVSPGFRELRRSNS